MARQSRTQLKTGTAKARKAGIGSSKPASQMDALESARDVIVRMREEGASLQMIADRLARDGLHVSRNAVDRFCKKHGIEQGAGASRDDASTPGYRAFPLVEQPAIKAPERPTVSPVASPARPSFRPSPNTRSSPQPDTVPVVPDVPPSAVAPPVPCPLRPPPQPHVPVETELKNVVIDLGIPATLQSIQIPAPAPTPIPSQTPALPAGVTHDHLVVAKFIHDFQPYVQAIENAHKVLDFDATCQALRDAISWLESQTRGVPEFVREHARNAIAQMEQLLTTARRPVAAPLHHAHSLTAPQHSSPPLYTPSPSSLTWEPTMPLVVFGDEANTWMIQDACEGTLILGATGSGKTSGSGALLARSFLNAHFGGLVLTAKQDEAALWERYAAQTGRSEQLCIVRPGGPFHFNFMEYQASLPPDQGGSIENTVEMLYSILDGFSNRSGSRGGEHGAFWANTSRQLLRNLLRVMLASRTPVKLGTLRAFMSEAPQSLDDAKAGVWKQTDTFGPILSVCERAADRQTSPADRAQLQEALRYWLCELPSLNSKTRSIVVTDFTSMIDLFFDPTLQTLLQTDTTITPEDIIHGGAVIVVDLPIEKDRAIGRLAQLVWKQFFQSAVKRRTDATDDSRRPVFLWIDEFQSLLSEGDTLFQATARSARCASVYLTQSLPGLYAQAGPTLSRERIDALAGNLATKILHANSDPTTNHWAAEQLGKSMQYRATVSSPDDTSPHRRGILDRVFSPARSRTNVSPTVDFEVQPSEFTKLRTGSASNGGLIDAFVTKSGGRFSSGKHWFRATFQQEYNP